MKMFLSNIILAFAWSALSGSIDKINLIAGFIIGYFVLGTMSAGHKEPSYFSKVGQMIGFVVLFFKEVMVSTLRITYDVLTPTNYMKPGVIAVQLDARTDAEITLLANVITLTPGTLSLDVSDDRKFLYIHAMYIDDPDDLRREIKDGLERKLLELMR